MGQSKDLKVGWHVDSGEFDLSNLYLVFNRYNDKYEQFVKLDFKRREAYAVEHNKVRMQKAVFNKMFLAAVLIGCTITIFGLIPHLQGYYREINMENQFAKEFSDIRNPMLPISTLFNS